MRAGAIIACLYYGLLPWWCYERRRHYSCSYWRHLWINLALAWRWATCRQTYSDMRFELETNWRRRTM